MTEAPTGFPIPGLAGEVAAVTGAAGGIGAAVVTALRAAGATVVAWDLAGGSPTDEAAADGTHVEHLDVTDRAGVQRRWADAEAQLGPISVLVSAAGVMDDDWDRCLAVNAGGARNMLDTALAAMTPRGRGSVVVISSNAAATPRAAFPAYAASKAAATSYARSVGIDAAVAGVRVNLVSPGSTETPMLTGMLDDDAARQALLEGTPQRFRLGIPLGRVAQPADIADAAVVLASDAARHIVLHDLRVDGGATLDQ